MCAKHLSGGAEAPNMKALICDSCLSIWNMIWITVCCKYQVYGCNLLYFVLFVRSLS